jgi:hypothetical protein
MQSEGNRRRVLDVLKAPKCGIEIRDYVTDILVKMGYEVHGLGFGSALGADEFLCVAVE